MAEADDAGLRRDAWWLALAPALFLVHFGAVYAFNALACRFGGLPSVTAVVLALTAIAAAVLLWRGTRARSRGRGGFVAHTVHGVCVLAALGMLLVALPVLLVAPCA